MLVLELSEELKAIKQTCREFGEKEIEPILLAEDQAPKEHFNWEIVRKGARIGLLGLAIPEEYGGAGHAMFGTGVAVEELCSFCSGIALIFGAHALGISPILFCGDYEAYERFLPPLAGNDPDNIKLAAFAITEPDCGSDVEDTVGSRTAHLMTFAEKDGDSYVLNGRKCFISNGAEASLVTVFASLEKRAGVDAWTCFAVPTDTPGFSVGAVEDKLGQRAASAAELILEDVRVPKENVIGGERNGWILNRQTLDSSRAVVGAIATGIARRAYEKALKYATERYQGGKKIIEHQAIQMMLADMSIQLEACQLMWMSACYLADNEVPPPAKNSAMAKVFCSDAAMKITLDAVQILGGYGYMRDYGVEKCMRDARLTQIYEGTNQINRLAIMEAILEEISFKGE